MQSKRALLSRLPLAALAAALLAAGSPAAAQFKTALQIQISGPLASRAAAIGEQAEEIVSFSGQVAVTGREITDPVFKGPPVLELVVDLAGLTGTGSVSGTTYVTAAHAIVHRPLLAFDKVQLSFPYYPKGSPASARTGLLTLNVYYNATGGLSATASVATPSF